MNAKCLQRLLLLAQGLSVNTWQQHCWCQSRFEAGSFKFVDRQTLMLCLVHAGARHGVVPQLWQVVPAAAR